MNRRKIEISAAVIVLLLLVLLLAFLLWRPKDQPAPVNTDNQQSLPEDAVPQVNPALVPPPTTVSAATITRTFVERYGSYSSESNLANIDDVKVLATARYQAELESIATQYAKQTASVEGYSGVSTTIISMKATSETDAETVFLVTTRREESVGNPGNTTTRYQDVEVRLVKSGDTWLVDDLEWK